MAPTTAVRRSTLAGCAVGLAIGLSACGEPPAAPAVGSETDSPTTTTTASPTASAPLNPPPTTTTAPAPAPTPTPTSLPSGIDGADVAEADAALGALDGLLAELDEQIAGLAGDLDADADALTTAD